MTTVRKLTWVEFKLFLREPTTAIFTFALPLIFLFVLAGVFGNSPDPDAFRGVGPTDYYVPAYIGLVIASIGLVSLPLRITGYRERGVLRRFRASSVPLWAFLCAQLLVMVLVTTGAAVVLVVATFIGYDVHAPVNLAGLVAVFILSVLSFGGIGLVLGAVLPGPRSAQGSGMLLFFAMFLLGGAGPPEEVLTPTLRNFGNDLPLTYVTRVLQDQWLGFGWDVSSLAVVAGFGALSIPLAAAVFRWE